MCERGGGEVEGEKEREGEGRWEKRREGKGGREGERENTNTYRSPLTYKNI